MRHDLRQAARIICALTMAFLCSTVFSGSRALAQDTGQQPAAKAEEKVELTKDAPGWIEARLAKIHRKLRITSAQEAAWNAYAKGMRETALSMRPLYMRYYQEQQTMTAVEGMQLYMEMSEAHAKVQKILIPLFEKLYNELSAEQKSIADEFFTDHPRRGRHKK